MAYTQRINLSQIKGMNIRDFAHSGNEVVRAINVKQTDNGLEIRNGARTLMSDNIVPTEYADLSSIVPSKSIVYDVMYLRDNYYILMYNYGNVYIKLIKITDNGNDRTVSVLYSGDFELNSGHYDVISEYSNGVINCIFYRSDIIYNLVIFVDFDNERFDFLVSSYDKYMPA